jgi:hypothetical protein
MKTRTTLDGKPLAEERVFTHRQLLGLFGIPHQCPERLLRMHNGYVLDGACRVRVYQTRVCIGCDLVIETSGNRLLSLYSFLEGMRHYKPRRSPPL